MSTTPLLPELTTTNQHQRWSKKEDQALRWAWQAGAADDDMAAYFNRSAQAVKMRASTLKLGRRKSIPKAEPVLVKDAQMEAENKALKADINRITTAFDSLIETLQTINVELKNR